MATFLNTQAISSELNKLIKEAKKKIILVSPFLQTSDLLRETLNAKIAKSKLEEFTLIYRPEKIKKDEINWYNKFESISMIEKSNLHAKCYLNEEKAIITSMNLYQYSQQNNIEMGILITKKDDLEAYKSLVEEISELKHIGTWKKTVTKDLEKLDLSRLTNLQKLNRNVLILWRNKESLESKLPISQVLTDNEIEKLTICSSINDRILEQSLPRIKFEKYAYSILKELYKYEKYHLGLIKDTQEKKEANEYNRILLSLDSETEIWFDYADKNLPEKGKNVAVILNKNWFNHYFLLD